MNQDLLNFISDDTPKINPDIGNGLAVKHMEHAEQYLDSACRAVLKDLEKSAGVVYLGMEPMTPAEEFIELTKGRNNAGRRYNLARTDTYMVKMKFKYNDCEFEKPLRLPIVGPAGRLHIWGTNHVITPVMADKIISITPPKIFVRLMSVRYNFDRFNYTIISNGLKQTLPIVKSSIYNSPVNRGRRFSRDTPLVYYLLCKHGLAGMFKKYLNMTLDYGEYGKDITENKYPEDKYVIVRSLGIKPKKLTIPYYEGSNIAFAIKKEDYSYTVRSIMAAIYFIIDQWGSSLTHESFDDPSVWKVCLGEVFFGESNNVAKLIDDINGHLSSVDQYIDEIMKIKFKAIGMPVEDMYEFFYIIIDRFDKWLNDFMNIESDLYSKELSILQYVMQDLIRQTVMFYYDIKKKCKNGKLKENDLRESLRRTIKTDAITNLNKRHGEVNVINYAGDNMAFGMTHNLIPQDKTSKDRGHKDNVKLNDPTIRLHVSMAEVRTYSGMSKSAPDGSTRINMHLQVDEDGGIIRNKELEPMLEKTQKAIKRD